MRSPYHVQGIFFIELLPIFFQEPDTLNLYD